MHDRDPNFGSSCEESASISALVCALIHSVLFSLSGSPHVHGTGICTLIYFDLCFLLLSCIFACIYALICSLLDPFFTTLGSPPPLSLCNSPPHLCIPLATSLSHSVSLFLSHHFGLSAYAKESLRLASELSEMRFVVTRISYEQEWHLTCSATTKS